jgi:hypothetical protein
MARSFHHSAAQMPTWRRVGAALAAFALGAQLGLSGLLIGVFAVASDQADGWVICAHDAGGSSKPEPAKSHDECPACTFAQSVKLIPTLPESPVLAVLQGRSERMPVLALDAGFARQSPSPYSSRAPPSFA